MDDDDDNPYYLDEQMAEDEEKKEEEEENEEEEEEEEEEEMNQKDEKVPYSMEVGDWPAKSPADRFCYLCSFDEDPDRNNVLYKDMIKMFDAFGIKDDFMLAVNIKRRYDDKFKKKAKLEWTLNSIKTHGYEHAPGAHLARQRDSKRTIWRAMEKIKQTGMAVKYSGSGIIVVNTCAADEFMKMGKFISQPVK